MKLSTSFSFVTLLIHLDAVFGQDSCFKEGSCISTPLDVITNPLDEVDCWEHCKRNRECEAFTYFPGAERCFLFPSCNEISTDCPDCITARVTCVPSKDFKMLVFGMGDRVIYIMDPTTGSNEYCNVRSLSQHVPNQPSALVSEHNVTICGGSYSGCQSLSLSSEDESWENAPFGFWMPYSASLQTYDGSIWTFLGEENRKKKIIQKRIDESAFTVKIADVSPFSSLCATRLNQSHAIASQGESATYLFHDESKVLTRVGEVGDNILYNAVCGLSFTDEHGYQFLFGGGREPRKDGSKAHLKTMRMLNIDSQQWTEARELPYPLTSAIQIQYENTFLLTGGYNDDEDEHLNTILMYDPMEGWDELPGKLREVSYNHGIQYVGRADIPCTTS